VQSRTFDISALTVFVAVITGVVLLGIAGGILAIPVAGCVRVLVLDFIEERHNERLRRQRIAKVSA
jgi:predicted PurR-regulated permease PerM